MAEEKKAKAEKKPKVKKVVEKKEKEEKETTKEEPKVEENKSKDNNNGDGKKDLKEEQSSPPPPPPEIVLRVFMHCEGCARKVRKCLKGFDGVEDVTTDCKTHKVVVKGEKADPLKVLDRLQKKIHRQVDLLSPVPQSKPPVEEPKKVDEKEPPKKQEVKKEEPKVMSVVLKVHMHCEPCSLEIKRRIERMKEVEEAIPDLKNSQVTVKGTFDPQKLVEHVYKRTGKQATIVEKEPPQEKKKDDNKGKDSVKQEKKKAEKKVDEGKKVEEKEPPPKEQQTEETAVVYEGGPKTVEEGAKAVELTRNEFQYYPPTYAVEMYAYPPQIFSDENPNACSIM